MRRSCRSTAMATSGGYPESATLMSRPTPPLNYQVDRRSPTEGAPVHRLPAFWQGGGGEPTAHVDKR